MSSNIFSKEFDLETEHVMGRRMILDSVINEGYCIRAILWVRAREV